MTHANVPRRWFAATAAALMFTLAACGGDGKASSATNAVPDAFDEPAATATAGDGKSLSGGAAEPIELATADTVAASSAEPGSAVPTRTVTSGDRKLVIVMTVGVEVADAAAAVDEVIDLATLHGGELYNSSLDLTDPATAAGDLVFKLPPTEVDGFLRGLDPGIGRRTGLQGTTSDVTTQLTDLDAQILTARKSVERVRALLEAAVNLGEVITLEGELSTRETHLEQLLAQQSGLAGQVAMATITVHLTTAPAELAKLAPEKEQAGIGAAFRDGWKAFVSVLTAMVRFVGYTAPFLLIGALVLFVGWRVSRRRAAGPPRNRSAAPPPPPAPVADPHRSSPDYADAARTL